MTVFLRIISAEMTKQQRQLFADKRVFFSLLLWPLLLLMSSYYMFKPFSLGATTGTGKVFFADQHALTVFVLTGQLGYTFMYAMTESAWRLTWERWMGTLEAIILTPVSRLAFLVGESLAFLLQGVWMYTVMFSVLVLFSGYQGLETVYIGLAGLGFMVLASISWGTLMNSLFLLSRDVGLMFQLFQDPVNFFAGIQVPVTVLPLLARAIGIAIPLTSALQMVRLGFVTGNPFAATTWIISLLLSSVAAITVGWRIMAWAEDRARTDGTLSFY